MTSQTVSMSGLHSLSEIQKNLFTELDLEVHALMTTAQLNALLSHVTKDCEEHYHPVLTPIMLEVLDDIRFEQGLTIVKA